MSRMILSYSFIANNETLWTRNSDPGNIDNSEAGIGYTGDIVELLKDFYRLEYTYSTIKNNPFNGMERRKDAILDRVTSTFAEVTEEVKAVFAGVFSDWLRKHALTDPVLWAQARVEDATSSEGISFAISSFLDEYLRYTNGGRMPYNMPPSLQSRKGIEMLNSVLKYPEAVELFWDFFGGLETYLEEKKQQMREEWEGDPEWFKENYDLSEDASEEEVEAYIEENTQNNTDAEQAAKDLLESIDYEGFLERMDASDPDTQEAFLQVLGSKVIFPLWFAYWQPQGIEETRANVENAYNGLLNADGLGNTFAAVNIAINTSHQSGSMLEYVDNATNPSESLKTLLDGLTKGDFVEEVNDTLRQVGVQV